MSKSFDLVNNMASEIQKKVVLTDSHIHGDLELTKSLLPKDLSIEQLEAAEKFSIDLAAASLIAASRVMVDNELEQVSASFELPHGSIEHTVDKEIEIAGETKNGYSVTSFQFVTEGKENVLAYAQDLVANTDYGTGDLEADSDSE